MDISNSVAGIELVGHSVKRLEVTNKMARLAEGLPKYIDMDYEIPHTEWDEENKCFIGFVHLKLDITVDEPEKDEKDSENLLKLSLLLEGCFIGENLEEDEFSKTLEYNGTATLYSIARAIISTITSQSLDGNLVIPMINVYDFAEEKRKQENSEETEQ